MIGSIIKSRTRAKPKARNRNATFDANLVYVDEPQLITLVSGKSRVVAVAIPDDDFVSSKFLAVTVHKKDWHKYLDGIVDLRYLYTAYSATTLYVFDLRNMKDKIVTMNQFVGDVLEDMLPSPRFFSASHTEHYTPLRVRQTQKRW
jgi:hypothetical protein